MSFTEYLSYHMSDARVEVTPFLRWGNWIFRMLSYVFQVLLKATVHCSYFDKIITRTCKT